MIAMHRRMRDEGAAALQFFREDILPLVLLFAVSLTGLLLTVSSTWLRGYGYEFMSLTHAVTVIVTLSLASVWEVFPYFSAARTDRGQLLQGCGARRRACKVSKVRACVFFSHACGRSNQGSTGIGLPV